MAKLVIERFKKRYSANSSDSIVSKFAGDLKKIQECLSQYSFSEDVIFAVWLCFEKLFENARIHGNGRCPLKPIYLD